MKAEVQYNDFIGTSAADISDHTDLNKFLEARGVDIGRYDSIGIGFYAGYSSFFSVSIICVDKTKSTDDKPFIVSIDLDEDLEMKQFFNLFKRFNVVAITKHGGYQDSKIDETIRIDKKEDDT